KEYWIGFKGEMIDRLVASGYFSACSPVFDIGLNERIIDLYLKARDIANEDRIGAQPALSGIVMHLLGLMYYRQKSSVLHDEDIIGKVDKAKVVMRENVYENLSPQEVAERVGLGYSGFRKAFREYAGTSPAQYMKELKINEAKLLLATTNTTIKEISYHLKYDNPEYFSISFKRRTGKTPLEYRNFARIKKGAE
ncbi:helix-turn-helix transcriptional regulator, partial [Alistipes indistinctus]